MGKLWSKVKDRALDVLRDMSPEVEEESWLDLQGEAVDGRRDSGYAPVEPVTEETDRRPVYRRDGQIHSFDALPFPGSGKRLTRAQYDARYGGARPEPKNSVRKFNQGKAASDD